MKGLPYKIELRTNGQIFSIKKWCLENIGPRRDLFDNELGLWTVFWSAGKYGGCYVWCFEHEQDAALFALRWV